MKLKRAGAMPEKSQTITFTNAAFIKDIEHYRQAFQAIESLNLSTCDYLGLKQMIEVDYRIPLLQSYYPEAQLQFRCYRVRRAAGFLEGVNQLSSYSMPPPELTRKARANFDGSPVFYCATLPQTAVAECNVLAGEEIFLSIWEVKNGHLLGLRSFMTNGKTLPPVWEKLFGRYEHQLNAKMATYTEKIKESIWYINNKLSNWFLKPNDYSLSAFLGHYFLYDTDLSEYKMSADAILYPSIAQQQQGINLAFSPSGFLKLHLKEVNHCRYKKSTSKGVDADLIRIGKVNVGQNDITWYHF